MSTEKLPVRKKKLLPGLTLFAILILPTLIYIYFALGVPKAARAPFFGPRKAVQVTDKNGNPKTDTAYYTVPHFITGTAGGQVFDTRSLEGQLYIAIFISQDSLGKILPILAEDMRTNRGSYKYAKYVFIYKSANDSVLSGPDLSADMRLGRDTVYTLLVTAAKFDSLHHDYFIPEPGRPKDPWATWSDAVLVDYKGRIRGYYNIRYAAEVKKMKEDIKFINFRDRSAETVEKTTIEKKR
jgi:hypothetical protein